MNDADQVQIMTTYRAPYRIENAACGMCGRNRPLVFDLTGASGRSLEVLSVCDECAPRANALMSWIGRVMSR